MPDTSDSAWVIAPQPQTALPVKGADALFPVNRVFCVGRNYAAHAVEMGHDPDQEPPFFFMKNAATVTSDGVFPYPAQTADLHHEVELVVAIGEGGSDIAPDQALAHVWGYAIGLDMTRRDLQTEAKQHGRPWEIAKSFDKSAPCGPLVPVAVAGHPDAGEISLDVNGARRQTGDLNQMTWKIPEIIAHLSRYFMLQPGDIIMTGTPAGVGPVLRGDLVEARIAGLGTLSVRVV